MKSSLGTKEQVISKLREDLEGNQMQVECRDADLQRINAANEQLKSKLAERDKEVANLNQSLQNKEVMLQENIKLN